MMPLSQIPHESEWLRHLCDFVRTLERELTAVTKERDEASSLIERIRFNAALHYLGQSFDPEHMRGIANACIQHQNAEPQDIADWPIPLIVAETVAERDAALSKLDMLERSILDLSHPNMRLLLAERDALKLKAADRDEWQDVAMKVSSERDSLRSQLTAAQAAIP